MNAVARKPRRVVKTSPRQRQGAIAVMAALFLSLMLAMMCFAIDLGHMTSVRTDLQCAADAGALAGVGELVQGEQAAINAANSYVMVNMQANSPVAEADMDINVQTGRWNAAARQFVAGQNPPNAVQVIGQRNNTRMFFGQIFGQQTFQMQASAVAIYQPRDIVLVLDYSGSMRTNDKIGALKDSVSTFIDVLQQTAANDQVGVSSYATQGRLLQSLTLNLNDVDSDVRRARADGWTNMGQGMELGLDELINNARVGAHQLLVVMTDGKANRPTDRNPRQYVLDQADRAATAGIPIVAISFSADSDQGIMQSVADKTQGVHYHVAGSVAAQEEQLKDVFREVAQQRPLQLVQ